MTTKPSTTERSHPWRSRRRRLLVAVVITVIGLAAVVVAFNAAKTGLREDLILLFVTVTVSVAVGALILDRRPGHAIGRLSLLLGVLMTTGLCLAAVAIFFDQAQPRNELIVGLAALGSSFITSSALFLSGPLLLVRFPDGRITGRLGRLVDPLILVVIVCQVATVAGTTLLEPGWIAPTRNPIWINLPPVLRSLASIGGFVLLQVTYAATFAVIIRRYRAGDWLLRAQVRWVAAAAALTAVCLLLLVASIPLGLDLPWLWSAWILSTSLPSIAIGLAVTRYRLYDIDRIISRTIGWVVVTGILAGVFAAGNIGLQTILAPLTASNTLAVAASTLVAAALFQPLRARVQRTVDRRFNRAHYDAERSASALADRLRDEVDLEALRTATVGGGHASRRARRRLALAAREPFRRVAAREPFRRVARAGPPGAHSAPTVRPGAVGRVTIPRASRSRAPARRAARRPRRRSRPRA